MVLGLQILKVKRDVLLLEPANQRLMLNPVSKYPKYFYINFYKKEHKRMNLL